MKIQLALRFWHSISFLLFFCIASAQSDTISSNMYYNKYGQKTPLNKEAEKIIIAVTSLNCLDCVKYISSTNFPILISIPSINLIQMKSLIKLYNLESKDNLYFQVGKANTIQLKSPYLIRNIADKNSDTVSYEEIVRMTKNYTLKQSKLKKVLYRNGK